MSNYFNEAGEPLMDGSAMRYEMYLDSIHEPDPDDEFYANIWGDEGDEDYYYEDDESSVPEDAMMEIGLFGE